MQNIEHRHVARTKLDKLAYIHIEPNNGGIILNVSHKGLGFRSVFRVEPNGPLRFSLHEQNRRIEARGELIWTDEIQNIGGLRFTALTDEAREQIRDWVSQSEPAVDQRGSPTLGSAFLRALLGPSTQRFVWLKTRAKSKLSGFSRGLATGVLFSALTASVILFFYGYRHQFGESLIRIGQRLAANRDSEPLQSARSRAVVSPIVPAGKGATPAGAKSVPAKTTAPVHASVPVHSGMLVRSPASLPQQIQIQHATTLQTQAQAGPVKPPELKLPPTATTKPVSRVESVPGSLQPSVPTSAEPAPASPVAPTLALPPASVKADSVAPTHTELAGVIHDRVFSANSDSSLRMFFDVGRFKQEQLALGLSDRLAQLGFRTNVVRRGHLWMSSYQVLVGPYNNEEDERKINGDLRSHGYKPQPFETGSRDFAFRSRVTIDHSQLPTGDFAISWESYIAEAKVKFAQGHEVVATANGKWINRSRRYSRDEYVYQKQANGSRPLLEIHFAGLDRALVLRSLP